jgi:hypothetical protein
MSARFPTIFSFPGSQHRPKLSTDIAAAPCIAYVAWQAGMPESTLSPQSGTKIGPQDKKTAVQEFLNNLWKLGIE